MPWQKITLSGVGLLGGSLGLAIKRAGLAREVWGFVRRQASVEECLKYQVVDHATLDLHQAVNGADLIILCTPLAQMADLVRAMRPSIQRGAIITDVGSVKGILARDLEPLAAEAGATFVGSHPMAGSEKMGVCAGRADLFKGAVSVVTPTSNTPDEVVERVVQLWKDVGAQPMILSPEAHDEFVSRSSHLPHVIAAELANYVLSPAHAREQSSLCATGFRDTTRIASGSPEMWRDIAMANSKHLSRVLRVFIDHLEQFQVALEERDEKAIGEFFQTAKDRRDKWSSSKASASPE